MEYMHQFIVKKKKRKSIVCLLDVYLRRSETDSR